MMVYKYDPDTYCNFTPEDYIPRRFTTEEIIAMGSKSCKDKPKNTNASNDTPAIATSNVSTALDDRSLVVLNDVQTYQNVVVMQNEVYRNVEVIENDTDEAITANVEDSGEDVEFVIDTEEIAVTDDGLGAIGGLETAEGEDSNEQFEDSEEDINDDEVQENINDNSISSDEDCNTPARIENEERYPNVIFGTPARRLPPKTYFGLVPGSLKNTYLGNLAGNSLVFQILKIEKSNSLRVYKATISDGIKMSDNVFFYQNLVKKCRNCGHTPASP